MFIQVLFSYESIVKYLFWHRRIVFTQPFLTFFLLFCTVSWHDLLRIPQRLCFLSRAPSLSPSHSTLARRSAEHPRDFLSVLRLSSFLPSLPLSLTLVLAVCLFRAHYRSCTPPPCSPYDVLRAPLFCGYPAILIILSPYLSHSFSQT